MYRCGTMSVDKSPCYRVTTVGDKLGMTTLITFWGGNSHQTQAILFSWALSRVPRLGAEVGSWGWRKLVLCNRARRTGVLCQSMGEEEKKKVEKQKGEEAEGTAGPEWGEGALCGKWPENHLQGWDGPQDCGWESLWSRLRGFHSFIPVLFLTPQ